MSARCPEGHLSDSLDYCDVCGSPMGAGGPPPAGASGTAAPEAGPPGLEDMPQAATQTCPHCGSLNVADALFCESCGYDFTTGTPPMGASPSSDPQTETEPDEVEPGEEEVHEEEVHEEDEQPVTDDDPDGGEDAMVDASDDESALPEEISRIVDTPAGEAPSPAPSAESPPQEPPAESRTRDTPVETPPQEPVAQTPSPEPVAQSPSPEPPAATAHRKARHTPPSRALAEAWVVEMWVDPDWYAVQQTEEACPSAGVPDIVLLTRSAALIGRPSGSLGVQPEVDAGADSAVSRRHAQLTSDGQRWWVEDLGSSNGTFVGTVGEPLPTTPVPPGQRVEVDRDDRLYVGAWTRLVLRQATASERQGTG